MRNILSEVIYDLYGIKYFDLFCTSRVDILLNARYLLFYYLRNDLNFTLQKIGKIFELHHSTIISGMKAFESELTVSKKKQKEYQTFKNYISTNLISDKILLFDFLEVNHPYLSRDLKEYLNLKL